MKTKTLSFFFKKSWIGERERKTIFLSLGIGLYFSFSRNQISRDYFLTQFIVLTVLWLYMIVSQELKAWGNYN